MVKGGLLTLKDKCRNGSVAERVESPGTNGTDAVLTLRVVHLCTNQRGTSRMSVTLPASVTFTHPEGVWERSESRSCKFWNSTSTPYLLLFFFFCYCQTLSLSEPRLSFFFFFFWLKAPSSPCHAGLCEKSCLICAWCLLLELSWDRVSSGAHIWANRPLCTWTRSPPPLRLPFRPRIVALLFQE